MKNTGRVKTKQEILEAINSMEHPAILGFMYGLPYVDCDGIYGQYKEGQEIIRIDLDHIKRTEKGFLHIWGWPGPDYSFYNFDDYGYTWALYPEDFNLPKLSGKWIEDRTDIMCSVCGARYKDEIVFMVEDNENERFSGLEHCPHCGARLKQ